MLNDCGATKKEPTCSSNGRAMLLCIEALGDVGLWPEIEQPEGCAKLLSAIDAIEAQMVDSVAP